VFLGAGDGQHAVDMELDGVRLAGVTAV